MCNQQNHWPAEYYQGMYSKYGDKNPYTINSREYHFWQSGRTQASVNRQMSVTEYSYDGRL